MRPRALFVRGAFGMAVTLFHPGCGDVSEEMDDGGLATSPTTFPTGSGSSAGTDSNTTSGLDEGGAELETGDDAGDTVTGNDTNPGEESTSDGGSQYDGEPGEFVLNHDGRDYRLYVPQCYDPSVAAPLVIGFHGAGDSGANFYNVAKGTGWSSFAEAACYLLMIPDTKSPYNDFAVWSGNPNNDVPAMIAEMDEILEIVDITSTHYHVDPAHLHGFGFSDGGLFIAVTELEHSTVFASATIVGYGWGSGYIVQPVRKIAMQFVIGSNDSFYGYAQDSHTFLSAQGHPGDMHVGSGLGHDFVGLMAQYPPESLVGWMSANPLP